MEDENQPSEIATAIGHAAVAAIAGVVLGKWLKRNVTGVIVGAVLAMVVHSALDAPVSRAISKLGL